MGKNILCIEDNPDNMMLVKRALESRGYTLLQAMDGLSGVRMAENEDVDLILLDINLPNIDGLTVARMLREDPETQAIAILAVSAYSMVGDKERMLEVGCDGFIPKPIDIGTFFATVSTFLDRGKAGRTSPDS